MHGMGIPHKRIANMNQSLMNNQSLGNIPPQVTLFAASLFIKHWFMLATLLFFKPRFMLPTLEVVRPNA